MESIYTDGSYLQSNPGWHGQDAHWKLMHVLLALERAGAADRVKTVCDVGCGAGELVKEWARLRPDMRFTGCDISPQAHALCLKDAPENAHFVHGGQVQGEHFDAILAVDVLEHVPDTDSFLSTLEAYADLLVLHVPLDLSFRSVVKPEILEEERRTVGHIHFYTAAYLKRLLAARLGGVSRGRVQRDAGGAAAQILNLFPIQLAKQFDFPRVAREVVWRF